MPATLDWPQVLRESGIEHRARGANVGSGEINVKCPWCGTADPSYHLGINLKTGAYKCWRNAAHRGRTPLRLLTKLLSYDRARSILRKYGITVTSGGLQSPAATIPGSEFRDTPRPFELTWPQGLETYDWRVDNRFAQYLLERGFRPGDIHSVFVTWGLRVGRYGHFSGRIAIPYCRGGRAVYYTARAITPAYLRYKACKNNEAVVDPHGLLFNEDVIENPAGVILVEGALDAIKASCYSPLPAVALSTNHASAEQMRTLKRAKRILLMVDNDHLEHDTAGAVTEQALALYYLLIKNGVRVTLQPIPRGYKDLAAIPWYEYPKLVTVSRLFAVQRT